MAAGFVSLPAAHTSALPVRAAASIVSAGVAPPANVPTLYWRMALRPKRVIPATRSTLITLPSALSPVQVNVTVIDVAVTGVVRANR